MGLEYTGIRVRDIVRARRFYCEGLGLRVEGSGRMASGGMFEGLRDPETGAELELNYYPDEPPYREGDELDHLAFRVGSLDATILRLEGLGARLRIPPFQHGSTRLAFLSDPDGVWLEIFESTGPDSPPTSRAPE
jgi:catechol 2,3-dioxygenase-like lactoylglutathione lyase family enzyme